jgi:TonB family protein
VVAVAHGLVFLVLGLWTYWHPAPKPIETIQLINPGALAKGSSLESVAPSRLKASALTTRGSEAPPAPAPPQPRVETPAPVQPAPVTPPEPQPPVAPVPETAQESAVEPPPVQTDIPLKITKPKLAPVKPKAPTHTEKTSADSQPSHPSAAKTPKVKVNLKLVKHSANGEESGNGAAENRGTGHTASKSQAEGEGDTEVSSGEIASRLGGALQRAGTGNGSGLGTSGSQSGASGGKGEYIGLMTAEILSHWEDRAQWIATRVRPKLAITVAKDGTISNVTLVQSSGNPELDQSVQAAIRKTARFSEPPPDGRDATFTVTVK